MGGGTSSGKKFVANGREPCGMDVEKQKASGETTMLLAGGGKEKKKENAGGTREELEIEIRNWVGKWKRTDAIVEPSNS